MTTKTVAEIRTDYLTNFQLAQMGKNRSFIDKLFRRNKTDWKAIAANLASVTPNTKPKTKPDPTKWADYPMPMKDTVSARNFTRLIYNIRFKNGQSVAVDILTDLTRSPNWGPAIRHAINVNAYRQHRHLALLKTWRQYCEAVNAEPRPKLKFAECILQNGDCVQLNLKSAKL